MSPGRRPGRSRSGGTDPRRRVRRAVWPVLVSVAFVGVMFLAVFPTRTYLAQRDATRTARQRLEVLREENAALESRVAALHSDEEIERLARRQYNLVRPGEEAYAVLPPPSPPSRPTTAAAGEQAATGDAREGGGEGLLERTWDFLTGWF